MPGVAQPLLPPPKDGDPEDVVWALQTADTLWKRGEYHDAVAWIRRAANAAADAEADLRVIELAKAAAELAALVQAFSTPPEPAPPAAAPAVAPPAAMPSSPRVPSGIDIDVDVIAEESPAPAPPAVAAPAAKPKPPGPPPRPKAPPATRLPTPNPVPSPLRQVPFAEVASAAMIEEPAMPPPIAQPLPALRNLDSLEAMPAVPPAPPDFAPTPMAMPVAKSVPPPVEPPPPKVQVAPDAPRAVRSSTAPLGTPDPSALRAHVPQVHAPPALEPQTTIPDEFAGAIEVPPRPGRPASEPPISADVVTSAPPLTAPRPAPRAATPPMGSVPPPRVSLKPSAQPIASEDGVQSHVSDAPPRTAQGAAVHIPLAPKAPVVEENPLGQLAMPALTAQPISGRAVLLDPEQFEVLADVPDDAREALVAASDRRALLPDEVAPAPPMIIVLHGELEVRARGFTTRLDAISAGQVRLLVPIIPAEGELDIVGGAKGARYLALGVDAIERLRGAAPWVVQELEPVSDDVHVVAGALRGRHGARLDGGVLDAILRRAKTMRLAPGSKVVKQGEPVRAFILVGAGELTIRGGAEESAAVLETLDPGDILFAPELLGRQPAPATVRAGDRGALVIVANRAATEELMVTVPPLLEMLGEA